MAAGALIFAIGAVAPPHFMSEFLLRLGNGGLLLGILALSVAFLMSQAGLVALGAASVYGGVGYLFAVAMSEWGLSPAGALVASIVIVTLYATILGALIIRTTPLAFMMLTLAAGEMISHSVMLDGLRDYTSGADGLVVSFNGTLFGLQAADFANPVVFWPVVWSAAWVAGIAVWAVRRSRLGGVLRAIRGNEERMRFSGFDTYLPRLIAFVFVNVIAGFCGILHVLNSGFVSPESSRPRSQHQHSGGGSNRRDREFDGPDRGRSDLRLRARPVRRAWLHAAADGSRDRRVYRALPERRGRRSRRACTPRPSRTEFGGPLMLEIDKLSVSYGTVHALQEVDLKVAGEGILHGVIGPNGAGKSTLLDVVSGRRRPTAGAIRYRGEDITRKSVAWRRRRGMARSFQRTNIFPDLTVREQLSLVAWRLGDDRLGDVIDIMDLADCLDEKAGRIAYGVQRRVDVALALIGRPQLLLMDEPGAGLSAEETLRLFRHISDLIRERRIAAVVVEHDVDAVFACCGLVTVLDLGRHLATGAPAEIRADMRVITAYLGSAA